MERKLLEFVQLNFPSPEQGFLVSISCSEITAGNQKKDIIHSDAMMNDLKAHIVQLARKYQQGAIYEFRKEQNRIIRLTVPVCIENCDSKVELQACRLKVYGRQRVQNL